MKFEKSTRNLIDPLFGNFSKIYNIRGMKDLSYISTGVRLGILKTYRKRWDLLDKDDNLELKIFGYPTLRRRLEEGIEKANEQVDLERYTQWSIPWYEEVIKVLPEPQELDEWQGDLVEQPEEVYTKKKVKDYIQTLEGYRQFRNKVDDILLNFDFEKVHQVMSELGWVWATWEDEEGDTHHGEVPSVYALRQLAYKLLIESVERGPTSTGGFEVKCYAYDLVDEDGVPYAPDEPDDFEHSVCLDLRFIVESFGEIY